MTDDNIDPYFKGCWSGYNAAIDHLAKVARDAKLDVRTATDPYTGHEFVHITTADGTKLSMTKYPDKSKVVKV